MNKWQKTLPFVAAIATLPVIAAVVLFGLTWAIHLWNMPPWICACIALLLMIVGFYAVWRVSRAFIVGRFRFRLRTFLLGISLVAIILGTVGQTVLKWLSQGYAVQAVVQSGGRPGHWSDKHNNWLHARVGYDPFEDVEVVRVRTNQAVAEILRNKEQFSDLQQLSFGRGLTDASLQHSSEFNDFAQLQFGEFVMAPVTDTGLEYLSSWTNARDLFFNGCAFTDKGLAHLSHLPKLESLSLIGDEGGSMVIADAGMLHIGNMSTLKNLRLAGIPITDAGLVSLTKVSNLERLTLHRTAITENGVKKFRKALPDCWVTGMSDSFPTVAQIRQIRVSDTTAIENEIVVISDTAQIGSVKACLENLVDQAGVDWQHDHEWEPDSTGTYILHFEGTTRTLCSCLVGNGFLRNGWGLYRTLTKAESAETRKTLGIVESDE